MRCSKIILVLIALFGVIVALDENSVIFQLVSLVLTVVATSITIISHIIKWYKNAKKDGKITIDEVEDLVDTVDKDIKQVKNNNIDKENK